MHNGLQTNTGDSNLGLVGRRRFLGWISAAACGAVFSVREVKAGLFYSTKSVEGIPKSWVDAKGLDVMRYANYIKALKLKNVSPYMVLYPHFKTRGRRGNSLPPRYMWRNIAATLRVIDTVSSRMRAAPKALVSVYRSPAYNRAVRGRSQSQHLQNRAVDVQFDGVSAYTVSSVVRKMRAEGNFKGGVGRYRSFTHIDTRGSNADW
ncbi:MAG: hypothetical protein ACJAR1_001256 [Rubritalea sp.]|jgi:hypothetical protein